MQDITRGGLATILSEIVNKNSNIGFLNAFRRGKSLAYKRTYEKKLKKKSF